MKHVISIYVGTYAKYNNGIIEGGWINLPMEKDKLRLKLNELHGDEKDPEYMIQDYEVAPGIDFRAITECENIFALNDEAQAALSSFKVSTLTLEMQDALKGASESKINGTSDVLKLDCGKYYFFCKQTIKKEFCFNAGYGGGDEEKEAREMAEHAKTKEYFIAKNMSDVFEKLLSHIDNPDAVAVWDSNDGEECFTADTYANHYTYRAELTQRDRFRLLEKIETEREKFLKRLETWWKKYGADGIRSWTYYND